MKLRISILQTNKYVSNKPRPKFNLIYRHFFKFIWVGKTQYCVVVVIDGNFALQRQLMKYFEDGECEDSFRTFRGCGKPAITKQLDTSGNIVLSWLATATEPDANSMNARWIKYDKVGGTLDRQRASFIGVVELDDKANIAKGGLFKISPIPSLKGMN